MTDEHILFVNRSCTGCKGAMGIVGNPRYLPHVMVLALGEQPMWSGGNSVYKPGGGQGGQVYNQGTEPIINSETGQPDTVMGLMHHFGVVTVPTMVVNPGSPNPKKLAGAVAILGEMQRQYPAPVAAPAQPTGRTFGRGRAA